VLTPAQIETYTISALDRLRKGQPIEDSRLEIKREFIEHYKAARRLAGHLNASRGSWALWVIGVDEATGELNPYYNRHKRHRRRHVEQRWERGNGGRRRRRGSNGGVSNNVRALTVCWSK
jgi:hypothetical protein